LTTPFRELIYDAEAKSFIAKRWPQAKFHDASDYIHVGRFEVVIDDITADQFYPIMILEGWSDCLLGLQISINLPDKHEEVLSWISKAKEIKETRDALSYGGSNGP
jgi:hypothetical protein